MKRILGIIGILVALIGFGAWQIQNPSSAQIGTAGQGYFVGPGILIPSFGTANTALVAAGQEVRVFQFTLPAAVTVGHIVYAAAGTVGSSTITVGIYDANGNKLIDSGTFDGGSSTPQSKVITAVNLPPGVYYFAQSASTQTTLTGAVIGGSASAVSFMNKNANRVGTATAATAGVLPPTLGTITASSSVAAAVPLFEP